MGKASREKWEKGFTKHKAEVATWQTRQPPFWERNLFWGPVGVFLSVILAVLAVMKDVRWLLFVAWPCLLLCVWVATRDIVSWQRRATCFLVVIILAAVGHLTLHNWLQPNSKFPNASEIADEIARRFAPITKSEALSPAQVVTLYRLFKEDVPGIKSIDFNPVLLHVQSSRETFGVEPRLHADFVGLSKFVSFYVPSSQAVRDTIRFIADNYSTLTGIDQMELILTKPGEFPRSTETMKFTGSIVIYHEDALSNADLATLENYYNARRVTPIWRGTAYLQTQILLRRGGEALERLSKVPPAMQTPKDELLAVTGITAGVDGERIEIRNKGPRATR